MKPTYAQRNELLSQLGFSSYSDYLASELWATIRNIVLKRDNWKCKLCDTYATVVHHLDYSETTLRGGSIEGLVTICQKCHMKVEFTKSNKKRTLVQAISVYRSIFAKRVPKKRHQLCSHCSNKPRKKSTMCRPCEMRYGERKRYL